MTTLSTRARTRITPNLFGMAYGLAGLATCWSYAAVLGLAPAEMADALFALSAAVWLVLVASYLPQVWHRPGGWRAELADPVLSPFVSLVPIVGMLVAIGLMPNAPVPGRWLYAAFAIVTTVVAAWLTGQWIESDLDPAQLHSGYILPTVAGGLIGSIGAAAAGWTGLAHAFMGFGVLSWLLIGSVVLARLLLRTPLPRALVPTLAIEVAPPALTGLAYLAITHGRVDAITLALGGFTAFTAIVQVRLIPLYRRIGGFTPAFWSFAFPYAAAATFALHIIAYARPAGYRALAWIVLLAITGFIAVLATETGVALANGRFQAAQAGRR